MATHHRESSESSRHTRSASPRAHVSDSGSRRDLDRKPSKRRHHKKSSKSRSDKGSKRTKFSSPFVPHRRTRRHPSSSSQSRFFCPHRRETHLGQPLQGGIGRLASETPSPGAEHLIVLPSGRVSSGPPALQSTSRVCHLSSQATPCRCRPDSSHLHLS
ncbi:hypothetical protein MTO96_010922 [Rhipicephalus appendiculatus]